MNDYQKNEVKEQTLPQVTSPPTAELVMTAAEAPSPWTAPVPAALPEPEAAKAEMPLTPQAIAASLFQQGRYAEVSDALLASLASGGKVAPEMLPLLARALASQGKLTEALMWCNRWVVADILNPSSHYLRAILLQELGENGQAGHSLRRAVYLHPDFVLAHFTLGKLARHDGKHGEAARHFDLVLHLLDKSRPEDPVPESGGLTCRQLTEIVTSIMVPTEGVEPTHSHEY